MIDIYFQYSAGIAFLIFTLSLIFKDTGVGLQKEDLPQIFEQFYQAKNSSAGTGIGLVLTKEFVELMNGTIEVNSEVVWGTEIRVMLPIINRANTPLLDAAIKSLEPSNQEKLKPVLLHRDSDTSPDIPLILIAEDNIVVITYVQSLLKALTNKTTKQYIISNQVNYISPNRYYRIRL